MTHSNTYIVFLNVLHMNVPNDENHNMRHKSALAGHFLGEMNEFYKLFLGEGIKDNFFHRYM